MKTSTIASSITLFAAAALAAPTSMIARDEETSYQVKSFTERKYDGVNINTVFFDVVDPSGSASTFECAPYDPALGYATENFQAGQVYPCAKDSAFSFSFVPSSTSSSGANELQLSQKIDDSKTISGNTLWSVQPICHVGGSTPQDEVCTEPSNVIITITLN